MSGVMLLAFIGCYLLAAFTVGRMAWELDAHRGDDREKLRCWVTGLLWPTLPARAFWTHVTEPRP